MPWVVGIATDKLKIPERCEAKPVQSRDSALEQKDRPMVALTRKSTKMGALGLGALAIGVAALTFGTAAASADPNDPTMTDLRPNGKVTSRQADSISGARHCVVSPGTLNTSSTVTTIHGEPMQRTSETGPSWVGSDGWQAIGLSPANPWGGVFLDTAKTGPQCKQGRADSAGRF